MKAALTRPCVVLTPLRRKAVMAAAPATAEDPDPASVTTPVSEILARALGYPYPRPPSSFVFHGGSAHAFDDAAWPPAGALRSPACVAALALPCPRASAATLAALQATSSAGLTPVLAIGSNAGPEQLARKFGGPAFQATAIPSTRALLRGFDVVYAPLLSSYGSVTATLHPSPATAVELYVTWLDGPALERMHETEAAYDLVELRLDGRALALGTSAAAAAAGAPPAAWHPPGAPVLCYVHQAGSLMLPRHGGSSPAALAEITALGRTFPALTQAAAQAAVERLVGGGRGKDDTTAAFILDNVTGAPSIRAGRVATLAQHAAAFEHPAATRLASLGSVFGRSVD